MTEQVQQQEIRVGFEKALTMSNPDWRNAFSKDQVNQFRHFYHQGVQDTNLVVELNHANYKQNVNSIMGTILMTGREEEIAAAQAAAQAAQDQADAEAASQALAEAGECPACVEGTCADPDEEIEEIEEVDMDYIPEPAGEEPADEEPADDAEQAAVPAVEEAAVTEQVAVPDEESKPADAQ